MGKRGSLKSGQVTNFIVIGVLLLLAAGLFLALKYNILDNIIQPGSPNEALPVKTYVETCAKDVAKEGIKRLGNQGGYIYIPPSISLDRDSHISLDRFNIMKVPLWHYKGYDKVPSLNLMENELDRYILENLPGCIDSFKPFDDGFEIEDGNMTVNTKIGEKDVTIAINYPLKIYSKGSGKLIELEGFATRLDAPLRKMHELASSISYKQAGSTFFENTTIDLMTIDPDVPINDLQLKCGRLIWQKQDVEMTIKDLVKYNLPRIRVDNTDYIPFKADDPETENEAYERAHFLWKINDKDYKDFKVIFTYEDYWNFKMRVRPSDGNTLRSNVGSAGAMLSFLCLNLYHFTYDINYPVLGTIRSQEAFEGSGFTFNFAMPVNIRSNRPDNKDYSVLDYRTFRTDKEFCEEQTEQYYRFMAIDRYTGYEIDDVKMMFQCVALECDLGKTSYQNAAIELNSKVPSRCHNGMIVASKEGYMESESFFSKDSATILYMDPLKKFNYEFELVDMDTGKEVSMLPGTSIAFAGEEDIGHLFVTSYPIESNQLSKTEILMQESNYRINGAAYQNGEMIGMITTNWTYVPEDYSGSDTISFKIPVGKRPSTDKEKVDLIIKAVELDINDSFMPEFK